jgi:hypothetical protein
MKVDFKRTARRNFNSFPSLFLFVFGFIIFVLQNHFLHKMVRKYQTESKLNKSFGTKTLILWISHSRSFHSLYTLNKEAW